MERWIKLETQSFYPVTFQLLYGYSPTPPLCEWDNIWTLHRLLMHIETEYVYRGTEITERVPRCLLQDLEPSDDV
jgi:hypothetical protein